MSNTRVMSAERDENLAPSLRIVLPNLIFGLLIVFNTIRLFRHTMWRDELQAFMLAKASRTPLELFAKLQYEGHPGLWHLLLWVMLAAFFTLRERQEAMLAGGAVYAVLVAIADVVASVARAMQAEGKDEAILIMSFPAGLAKQTSDPSLVFMPIKTFPEFVGDEA